MRLDRLKLSLLFVLSTFFRDSYFLKDYTDLINVDIILVIAYILELYISRVHNSIMLVFWLHAC